MQTYIEIPDAARRALIDVLGRNVAATLQLQLLAKMAHWNCRGPEFAGLHELFDEIAEHLRKQADTLAERAAALGGYVECDAATVGERSGIPRFEGSIRDGLDFADELAARLGERSTMLRSAIGELREHDDPATEHLLADVLAATEKHAWMLESHLKIDELEEEPGAERGEEAAGEPAAPPT